MNRIQTPRQGFHIGTKILLIALTFFALLAVIVPQLGGGDSLIVHTWIYPALPMLPVICVIALLIPGARRIAKSPLTKRILTIVAVFVAAAAAMFAYAIIISYCTVSPMPDQYFTAPTGGSRVVVMKCPYYADTPDLQDESAPMDYTAEPRYSYALYAMKNGLFFYTYEIETVYDQNVKEPVYLVEWLEDGKVARLYLPGFSGEGRDQTTLDFEKMHEALAGDAP